MMFGRFGRRRFGPHWRGDWEEWSPPWMQREWSRRDPRFFGPQGPWGGGRGWHERAPEQEALWVTAAEVARLFAIANRSVQDNPEGQARLRGFLERSRKELSDLIYGTGQKTDTQSDTPGVEQV